MMNAMEIKKLEEVLRGDFLRDSKQDFYRNEFDENSFCEYVVGYDLKLARTSKTEDDIYFFFRSEEKDEEVLCFEFYFNEDELIENIFVYDMR